MHTGHKRDACGSGDWDNNKKFESVNELIDRMVQRRDLFEDDLFELIFETANMVDFSHLKKWDDADLKIKKATDAVNALKNHTSGYFQIQNENKESEIRKKQFAENILKIRGKEEQVTNLKDKFLVLAMEQNAQKRGRELETFLNDLFTLFDLEPKKSFALKDEQIDGAFTFDNSDYLLEAKWQKTPIETSDLKKFAGTINGKLKNTLGLFISIDGFSQGAKDLTGQVATGIILMDGMDLNAILEGRIDLPHLLFRKRRHAAETGQTYLSIHKILQE